MAAGEFDPREAVDRNDPGGVVDGGSAEMPGVQDVSPADRDAQAEFDTTPESVNDDEAESAPVANNDAPDAPPIS